MNTNEFNLLTLAEAIETISSQTDLLEKEASSLTKKSCHTTFDMREIISNHKDKKIKENARSTYDIADKSHLRGEAALQITKKVKEIIPLLRQIAPAVQQIKKNRELLINSLESLHQAEVNAELEERFS